VEYIEATRSQDKELSPGLVWALRERMPVLKKHGKLALMDATHDTNHLKWLLYTLMVRDSSGSWLPLAHFLTQKGDGDIIALALRKIKGWSGWIPRYFIIDDLAAAQRAVRLIFLGHIVGEI